jgi:HlyD family secretion protein
MDRVIQKKKWPAKRILSYVGAGLLVTLILTSYLSTSGSSKLNVDQEKITVSEVRKGNFQETIPVNGTVMPIKTIYMDAIEGGRVEEIYVEDGAMMKKGEPILQLANTDLQLDLANRETAVFDLINNLQDTRLRMEQNRTTQLNQLADIEYRLKEAERKYTANKKLYEDKVISHQEFLETKNDYDYQLRKKELTIKTLKQDSVMSMTQIQQMRESVDRMQQNLALMRKKADDLTLKAPVDGQLTSLVAEIGESKTRGQRIGQIDVMSGFKVRAEIDEHYNARVFPGLEGTFTYAGNSYKLRINKIYTQVTDGRFQVDMEFTSDVPPGVRRGQTLQIKLALSDQTQAVLLARGGFYQQTGGNWVYKLSESGDRASKVNIKLGRQSTEFYEVIDGLQPGDKVVTSSYENYGDKDVLVIRE